MRLWLASVVSMWLLAALIASPVYGREGVEALDEVFPALDEDGDAFRFAGVGEHQAEWDHMDLDTTPKKASVEKKVKTKAPKQSKQSEAAKAQTAQLIHKLRAAAGGSYSTRYSMKGAALQGKVKGLPKQLVNSMVPGLVKDLAAAARRPSNQNPYTNRRLAKDSKFFGSDYGDVIDAIRKRIRSGNTADSANPGSISGVAELLDQIIHLISREQAIADGTVERLTREYYSHRDPLVKAVNKTQTWMDYYNRMKKWHSTRIFNLTQYIPKVKPILIPRKEKELKRYEKAYNASMAMRTEANLRFKIREKHLKEEIAATLHILDQIGPYTKPPSGNRFNTSLKATLNAHSTPLMVKYRAALKQSPGVATGGRDDLDDVRDILHKLHTQMHAFLSDLEKTEIAAEQKWLPRKNVMLAGLAKLRKQLKWLRGAVARARKEIEYSTKEIQRMQTIRPKVFARLRNAKATLKVLLNGHKAVMREYKKHKGYRLAQLHTARRVRKFVFKRFDADPAGHRKLTVQVVNGSTTVSKPQPVVVKPAPTPPTIELPTDPSTKFAKNRTKSNRTKTNGATAGKPKPKQTVSPNTLTKVPQKK